MEQNDSPLETSLASSEANTTEIDMTEIDMTEIGSYRVTRLLGQGGMGTVYEAEHKLLGSQAAIKVLLPEVSRDRDVVDRFFNEARAATAIKHPGIVTVYDFGRRDDDSAYIAMEYLDGEDLEARLKRCGRIPIPQALRFTVQIASALKAAHNHGIVHRDLKPGNVFIVPDPQVAGGERIKLLDFGIAKFTLADETDPHASQTRREDLLGTPAYMAPEQFRAAHAVDQRADLYAVGCILFEMICGRPPFIGIPAAVMASHLRDMPPAPSALQPGLTPELEAVIGHLLAKEPQERFQSAAELEHALLTMPGGPTSLVSVNSGASGTAPTGPSFATWRTRGATQNTAQTTGTGTDMRTAMVRLPQRRRSITVMMTMIAVFAAFIVGLVIIDPRPATETPTPSAEVATEQTPDKATKIKKLPPPPKPRIMVSLLPTPDRPAPAGSPQSEAIAAAGELPATPEQRWQELFTKLGTVDVSLSSILSGQALSEIAASIAEVTQPEPTLITWRVETEPPGAEILHEDGRKLGITPLEASFEPVSADEAERLFENFTVRLPSYEDETLELRYDEGFSDTLTLTLKPVVSIKTDPETVNIYDAEGEQIGVTPMDIMISRQDDPRNLVLKHDDCEDYAMVLHHEVEVPEVIALERKYRATIRTQPEGATVIDPTTGQELGTTPHEVVLSIKDDPVPLLLKQERHEDHELRVSHGDDFSQPVALEPMYVALIRAAPQRAAVFNRDTGEDLGTTPYEIVLSRQDPPVELVLKKDRHEDQDVTVSHGADFTAAVNLVPMYVATIRSQPARADIFSPTGESVGRTPYEIVLSRKDAPVALVLKKDRHEDQPLTVSHGDDYAKPVALTPMQRVVIRTRPNRVGIFSADGSKQIATTPWTTYLSVKDAPQNYLLRQRGYDDMPIRLAHGETLPPSLALVPRIPIRIVATPTPAQVFDASGALQGTTPLELVFSRSSEPIAFALKRDGYYDKNVEIVPLRRRTMSVKLDRLPGDVTVAIATVPAGAEIYAVGGDEALIATAPYEVTRKEKPGSVRYKIRYKGYQARTITVRTDRDQRMTVRLTKCEAARSTVLSARRRIVDPYRCDD